MQTPTEIVPASKPVVFERDGELWTTSLDVARVFEKRHDHVLDAIEKLECSQAFRDPNFRDSSYQSEQNRTMPMFEITQDGFAFLVMGFTGRKAAQFKEWYISEFNRAKKLLASNRDLLNELIIQGKKNEERLIVLYEKSQQMLEKHDTGINILDHRVERVETKVDNLSHELTDIKSCLPLQRRGLSKKTVAEHIKCIFDDYNGKCPCCMEAQVIDHNRRRLPECTEDHFHNRHENARDRTWLICRRCNSDRSSGRSDHMQVQAYFHAYQERLKTNLSKSGVQLSMAQVLAMRKLKTKNC